MLLRDFLVDEVSRLSQSSHSTGNTSLTTVFTYLRPPFTLRCCFHLSLRRAFPVCCFSYDISRGLPYRLRSQRITGSCLE